jgi:hypothetical protein
MNRSSADRVSVPVTGTLKAPLIRLMLSAGFFGVAFVPFAKVCLGC